MRRDVRLVILLVLVAVAARLAMVFALGDGFHFADETAYRDAALGLYGGEGFSSTYDRVPGYPILLAVLAAPAPASLVWLRLAQAGLVGIGAALVYLAGRRLAGPSACAAAAAIYALDPLLVAAAGLLYPEAAAAVLLVATVLAAWEASRLNSLGRSLVAGVLLGVLAQFRPVALLVVPVIALWVAATASAPARRRVAHAAIIGLAFLTLIGPWTYRNYQVYGQLVPVSLAGISGGTGVSNDQVRDRGLLGALLDRATRDPSAEARRMLRELGHFWEPVPSRLVTDDPTHRAELHATDPRLPTAPLLARGARDLASAASFGIEVALAVGGLWFLWRTRRPEAVLLVAVILVYALGHAATVGKLRYRITVLPLVFVLAGNGVAAIVTAWRTRRLEPAETGVPNR